MSTPAGGDYYNYRAAPQIDFGWLSQAWELFKAQPGVWAGAMFLCSVIVLVIAVPIGYITGYGTIILDGFRAAFNHTAPAPVSLWMQYGSGILFSLLTASIAEVFLGGLYRMALRQMRGEAISVAGLFSAFDLFLPLLAVGFLTTLLVTIGTYACILPGLVLRGLFMFAPLLVIDRRAGPLAALSGSVNILKAQWVLAAVFCIIAELIGSLGVLLCGVGGLVTYPIYFISIAIGYMVFSQPGRILTGYGTPPQGYEQGAGVWPPPPTYGQAPPPNDTPPPPPA